MYRPTYAGTTRAGSCHLDKDTQSTRSSRQSTKTGLRSGLSRLPKNRGHLRLSRTLRSTLRCPTTTKKAMTAAGLKRARHSHPPLPDRTRAPTRSYSKHNTGQQRSTCRRIEESHHNKQAWLANPQSSRLLRHSRTVPVVTRR